MLRSLIAGMRALLHPAERNAQIEEELRSFFDASVEEKIRNGMNSERARRAAQVEIGSREMVRHKTWSAGWESGVDSFVRDLRFAARQLKKTPGFAVTAVLTLALGIGANLAVFQLLYSAVLAPLPVAKPNQLVSLRAVKSPFDGQWFVSYPAYQRLRNATGASASVIARSGFGLGLLQVADQAPQDVRFQLVSDNFFSVLGVRPAEGRLFEASDARQNPYEWPVVVRHGFALQHFGSVRIVGRHAVFNGLPVVIVGVADKRFLGIVTGYAPDIWLPLEAEATGKAGAWFDSLGPGYPVQLGSSWLNQSGIYWLWLMARVPPGERAEAAARWTAALQPDLALRAAAARTPEARAAILHAQVRLVAAGRGEGRLGEDSYLPLVLLMTLSGVVFLAGCLNLANLQAARLSSWQRDFSVRLSLGASRWRLLRQILTEDAVLTLIGGTLAVVAGRSASFVLVRWASSRGWMLDLDMHVSGRFLLLGAGVAGRAGRRDRVETGPRGYRPAECCGTAMVQRDDGGAGEPVAGAGGDGGVLCQEHSATESSRHGNGSRACPFGTSRHGAWLCRSSSRLAVAVSLACGAFGCAARCAERSGGDVRDS
jgi:hypothetical protein